MEIKKMVNELKNWCEYDNYFYLKLFQWKYNKGKLKNLDWAMLAASITKWYNSQVFEIEDLLVILDDKCYVFNDVADVQQIPHIKYLSSILKAREYNEVEDIPYSLSPKAREFYKKEGQKLICFALYENKKLPHYEDWLSIITWYFETKVERVLKSTNPFSLC